MRPLLSLNDISVGSNHSLGSIVVNPDEMLDFAKIWDPQPFHLDTPFATEKFGAPIASGVFTYALFHRRAIERVYAYWDVVAGRALRDIRFHQPVFAGTVLTASLEVIDVVDIRENRGVVVTRGLLTGERGVPTLTVVTEAVVRRLGARSAGDG